MIEIHKSAMRELKRFPPNVLNKAKEAFQFLENGEMLSMPLSRPMPSIYHGCHELRFKDQQGAYRIIYFIWKQGVIFIPHIFKKKTQSTPLKEMIVAKNRIKEFVHAKQN